MVRFGLPVAPFFIILYLKGGVFMLEELLLWIGGLGFGASLFYSLICLFIYLLPGIIIASAILRGFRKMCKPIELEIVSIDDTCYYLENNMRVPKSCYDIETGYYITPIGVFQPVMSKPYFENTKTMQTVSFLYFKK